MANVSFTPSGNGQRGSGRPAAAAESFDAQGAPNRVLVVDDERDAVATLMALLRLQGYEVRGAFGGQEALELILQFNPHAILLDIGMPGMTGYDVARQIRQRHGKTHLLIAVTAWGMASDRILAQRAGFDHHVGKPYRVESIVELLRPLGNRSG